jgi:sec-independent protein translocase protein TatB
VALIVFGPKRLPEIGRKVGGLVRELRRATGDFRTSIEREIGMDPIDGLERTRKARRDILSNVSDPIREVTRGAIGVAREARLEAEEALEAGGASNGDEAAPAAEGRPPAPAARSARTGAEPARAAAKPTPTAEPTTAAPEKPPGPAGGEPGE